MTFVRAGAAVLVLALAACAGSAPPPADPAAKAALDRRLAALPDRHERRFPIPDDATPIPLAVGQWVVYRGVRNRQPFLYSISVVGEKDGAFWIQSIHDSYQGRFTELMLVDVGDRHDPARMKVRRLIVRTPGHAPREIVPPGDELTLGTRRELTVRWHEGMPQGEGRSFGGVFAGCYSGPGFKYHPMVPLSGVVESSDGEDPRLRIKAFELVDFGLTGARFAFDSPRSASRPGPLRGRALRAPEKSRRFAF